MIVFSTLLATDDQRHFQIAVSRDRLRQVLAAAAAQIQIDEEWYVLTYPDVREAIEQGIFLSAREHYIGHGYFEDRFPRPIKVDADWYLTQYPDVAEAIRRGLVYSPQQHFEEHGYREGRLPYSGWSL